MLGVVVLVGFLAAGSWWVLTQLGDDEAVAEEVLLEPAGDPGPDPFYESLDLTDADDPAVGRLIVEGLSGLDLDDAVGSLGASSAEVGGGVDGSDPDDTTPSAAEPRADGGSVGLYGGTRSASTCDVDQLARFLAGDSDKAAAWAGALGLEVDRIDEYLDRLTPTLLTVDTRVVNHGFVGGVATPREAVLQRGTAVLVDWRGVPRVKCSCGNPLLEPAAIGDDLRFVGEPWPAFRAEHVVIVEVAPVEVEVFVMVDVADGSLFGRPAGTTGAADVDDPSAPVDPSDPGDPGDPGDPPAPTTTEVVPPVTEPPVVEPPGGEPPVENGLGGPELSACGVIPDNIGIDVAVWRSGDVTCEQALDVAGRATEDTMVLGPDGSVGWEIDEWTCSSLLDAEPVDLFATCTGPGGYLEIRAP